MSDANFWSDQERARDIVQKVKALKGWVEPFDKMSSRLQGALEIEEMLAADPDEAMAGEVAAEVEMLREEIKKSYEEYVDQVGKEFAESTAHFQDALNDVLAGGQKIF